MKIRLLFPLLFLIGLNVQVNNCLGQGTVGFGVNDMPGFPDLPLDAAGLTAEGNTFGYYDHPAGPRPSPGFARYDNYLIKVYTAKIVCEVGFHLIQTGNTIRWGRGLR